MRTLRSATICVDYYETTPGHYPVLFPDSTWWAGDGLASPTFVKLCTKVKILDAGDYCLSNHPRGCVVETKRSPVELYQNHFTADEPRATRALDRLAECDHPHLLLECTASELMAEAIQIPRGRNQAPMTVSGHAIWDRLVYECRRRAIRLWLVGHHRAPTPRRRLGELIAHLLLSHHHAPLENPDGELAS